ncbi:MAG: helix-turn-helix domain-containing protein [Opitutaceae bacterium]|jgi:HTH-type transcriptional regulator/antitoxin HigA
MTENLRFLPDWASPPGDTIVDLLDERGLSQPEFAQRLGRALSFVNQLVAGQVAITLEIAKGLEGILGVPASFWIHRECSTRDRESRRCKP